MAIFTEICKVILNIILWVILLALLAVLLPFILIVLVARNVEALVYYCKYNAKAIRNVDVLWTFKTAQNQMNISGVFQLDGEIRLEDFQALLKERLVEKRSDVDGLLLYPQAKQHREAGCINYYWIEDEHFDMADHAYYLQQEVVQTEAELQTLISHHLFQQFPRDVKISPWEFVLIPYQTETTTSRKTIVLFRLEHAIADGSALAYFLINQLSDNSNDTGTMTKKFSHKQRSLLNIKGIWNLPLIYVRLLLQPKDTNIFRTDKLSGKKTFTWSKPIGLATIKSIKNNLKATINDVLVGCLSKSIGDYCNLHPQSSVSGYEKQQTFTTIFAVDTRSSISEAMSFRNQVAGVVLRLPTFATNTTDSVKETKLIFDNIKNIGEPISINIGWKFLSFFLPAAISKHFVFEQISKTTACVSNLMGPQYPVTIRGCQIDFITFWPPQTHTQTMGFSFCSYNEQVRMGLEVDTAVMKDPSEILNTFEKSIEELKHL